MIVVDKSRVHIIISKVYFTSSTDDKIHTVLTDRKENVVGRNREGIQKDGRRGETKNLII